MSLSKLIPFLILSMVLAVGCGGDDGDDGGADAGDTADASTDEADASTDEPDSGSDVTSPLGQSCTATEPGQGDCPDGWTCLTLVTGSWCSKQCGDTGEGGNQNHEICTDGYDGPGAARCFLGIDGETELYCSVACEDSTGTGGVCGDSTCDGTCPGDLMCEGILPDDMGNEAGKLCQ